MVALLDVNLLISLAWPNHIHHAKAHAWLEKNVRFGWATCPLTQCAFVRISSNPKIVPEAVTVPEAVEVLRRIVAHKKHEFWPDDLSLLSSKEVPLNSVGGHGQITDAYLLGLARHRRGCLATLDQGMRSFAPDDSALTVID